VIKWSEWAEGDGEHGPERMQARQNRPNKLNEQDDGMFEYRLSESGGTISLRSRIQLKRAYYLPEEYEMLREFFNIVVKKHNEQIVFKKKK